MEITSLSQIADLPNELITAKIFACGRLLQLKGRRRLPREAEEIRSLLKQAIPPRNEKGDMISTSCDSPMGFRRHNLKPQSERMETGHF